MSTLGLAGVHVDRRWGFIIARVRQGYVYPSLSTAPRWSIYREKEQLEREDIPATHKRAAPGRLATDGAGHTTKKAMSRPHTLSSPRAQLPPSISLACRHSTLSSLKALPLPSISPACLHSTLSSLRVQPLHSISPACHHLTLSPSGTQPLPSISPVCLTPILNSIRTQPLPSISPACRTPTLSLGRTGLPSLVCL